ncbi:MAG: hypothetical protein R3E44_13765 [Paracoccaceae bacterium]
MDLLKALSGGDRRSIGQVSDVVAFVLDHPARLAVLIDGMTDKDALIRMRCADAAEKISVRWPAWFEPFREQLVRIAQDSTQQEVRWHMAQILPRIGLTPADRSKAVELLFDYLDDKSRIVTVSSLSALADFAQGDASLVRKLVPLLKDFAASGSPAQRSRAKRLLDRMEMEADR